MIPTNFSRSAVSAFVAGYMLLCACRGVMACAADDGTLAVTSQPIVEGAVPADADIAVGPNHVVVITNEGFKVYPKSPLPPPAEPSMVPLYGSNGFWTALGAQTGPRPAGPFDPETCYDAFHDRFWIMAIENYPSELPTNAFWCIAVSVTGDPMGAWHKYRLDVRSWDATYFSETLLRFDSPNMAIDGEWVYLNAWINRGQTVVVDTPLWILEKSDLMANEADVTKKFAILPNPGGQRFYNMKAVPALAQKFDPLDSSPQYMIGHDPDGPNNQPEVNFNTVYDEVVFHAVVFSGGVPSITSTVVPLTLAAHYRSPQNTVPNPQGRPLRLNSARFWATPVNRGGALWATHHVRPPGSSRNVVYWLKCDTHGWAGQGQVPTVERRGEVIPTGAGQDDDHTYYPSIGVNEFGQALLTYNQSGTGPSDFISIRRAAITTSGTYVGEIKNDAQLGVYNPPCPPSGCGPQPVSRWGDYSGSESDPRDPCSFYSHHSWAGLGVTDRWRTWFARSTPPELCFYDFGPDYYFDGVLDMLDFAEFNDLFLRESPRADFNRDGTLNIQDHAELLRALGR